MNIYIMRHGEAELGAGSFEPELTHQGLQQIDTVARILQHERLDLILHSPKLRARQTVEQLQTHIDMPEVIVASTLLPDSEPAELVSSLADYSANSMLLVSHLPLVARLAGWLTDADKDVSRFATFSPAGVVAIECEYLERGCGRLAFVVFGPEYRQEKDVLCA